MRTIHALASLASTIAVAGAAVLLTNCKFPPPPDVPWPDGPVDAVSPDASVDAGPPECVASTQTCIAGNYTECDTTGHYVSHSIPNGGPGAIPVTLVMHDYPCPMGCHATEPRCNDVSAANGLDAVLANVSPLNMDVDLPPGPGGAAITIDTGSFDAGLGQLVIIHPDPLIGSITVPAERVTQPSGPPIIVLKVRTFTVRAGAVVRATGGAALAVASQFDIYVGGTLDLTGSGPGACSAMSFQGAETGGGGNYQAGSPSGSGAPGVTAGTDVDITPLVGGCAGYVSRVLTTPGTNTGGGPGRGGVQLVSRTKIVLDSTAMVDVSGGGGVGRVVSSGGTFAIATGGGAGGNVLLESPQISLAAGSIVAGRGGGGAASNVSGPLAADGLPGSKDGGGAGGSVFGATGGTGGTEQTSPSNGATTGGSAGGAGSAGKCVIRTRFGGVVPPANTMRLTFKSQVLRAR